MTMSTLRKSVFALVLAACALTGCSSDKDNDRITDERDQCPTVAAGSTPDPARHGCPAIDSDRDGILDHNDVCPGLPAGQTPDSTRVGCPAPITLPPTIACGPTVGDCDGDGVIDSDDQCPSVPKSAHESAARHGCPWEDRDGDGTEDAFDDCVADAPGAHPDPTNPDECPDYDNDEDGLRNSEDSCPDEKANPVVDGGQTIPDGGLPNDPNRPGCLLHPVEDAGSPEDALADPDASVIADATNADSDSGAAEAAVDASDVTDVQDASTATTTDVPPGNGNTTVIVQVNPTPAPVVDAGTPSQPIPTERSVSGLAIGTLIEGTSGRTAANTFCWITRRQVDYLMTHAFNRECREGETSCWRLANANVHVLDCGTTATPGCRFQDGRIFACETGAENIVVRHCAQGTVPCTAQNVIDAERTRHPSR